MSVRRKSYSKDIKRRRLTLEQLEGRRLLAVNIAQFQPAFADSVLAGTSVSEATDGIVSHESSWTSLDSTDPHWVEVQLPVAYPVGSAHVYLGQPNLYQAASFDLQYHDGASWQTITSVTDDSSTDHNFVFPSTITATRFRVHTSVDSQLRVKELVLLPPNGPAGYPLGTGVNLNVASQRAPTTTSVEGTHYAINAVDGYVSDDSSWVSDNSAGPHRLIHALPIVQKIRSVHLYSGEAGPGGTIVNPISDFSVQFEKPGGAFQAVPIQSVSSGTFSGATVTGNTSGELVINFSWPIDAKRIRINTNQASVAIREMVVLPANITADGHGYPIGTSVKFESPPTTKYDDYGDGWHRIVSRQNNRAIVADENGASQAVDATPEVERQYQLLYSYAKDAYRIRSEDTGQALQVKDASLDAGAAIVEGDYSAAPHQLWRLEPTDGGHFQVVNVWSGMVLHTGGAYPNEVTQQPFDEAADPANRVEWRMVFNKDYFKKGIGVIGTAEAFRPSWAYNWGLNSGGSGELPDDVVHTPMQWGRWNLGSIHQRYDDWNTELKPSYLLGYNEPDSANQSNMLVEEGIELWPHLEALDVPLLSPSLTHNGHGRTWLTDFADQADALGYRQDYAGMHWYGSPNVNNILNYIDTIQNISNGRDVWITEFSPVDWSGGSGNWSEETNYSFILEFMYRADRKENLDKYALFPFAGDQPDTPWAKSNPRANSFIGEVDGELTPYGKAYASWDGESDPELETLYVIHNRAASHRLQNTGGQAVDKASIRVEDDSAQWIIQDAGNDEVFITSVVDGRRAKLDNGNIVMSDPGATGWGVRWKIQQEQYGWHNIVHSGSGNYLRLNRINNGSGAPTSQTLDVVTPAAAANLGSTDWWFVKPYEAAIHSDFGDAPSAYPVTLLDDGARHLALGPQLGSSRDSEADGAVSVDANGDGSDEDGVMFGTISTGNSMAGVNVDLQNAAAARVDAWIDFDGDGTWDSDEQILDNAMVISGLQTLNYAIPGDAVAGDTFARVRLSTAGGLQPTGAADDGEVEDYLVNIASPNPPSVETVQINDGATQRSLLTEIAVTFDTEVLASNSAFQLMNRNTLAMVDSLVVNSSVVDGKTISVITFDPGTSVVTRGSGVHSLANANYQLTINGAEVSAVAGGAMMTGQHHFGDEEADQFFRHFGDSDGDRDVDGQDYGRFGLTFLKSEGDSSYNAQFDFDGDGDVDGQDYGQFGLQFLTSIDF